MLIRHESCLACRRFNNVFDEEHNLFRWLHGAPWSSGSRKLGSFVGYLLFGRAEKTKPISIKIRVTYRWPIDCTNALCTYVHPKPNEIAFFHSIHAMPIRLALFNSSECLSEHICLAWIHSIWVGFVFTFCHCLFLFPPSIDWNGRIGQRSFVFTFFRFDKD